jgi:DNA (cytosine-5)-methyltransferase 1
MRCFVQLTFGSLFAGIGGFDLGFERAGMACKWQVEIDDYATKVLEKHWPNVHRERDIRECGSHNLEAVDVICGGFPCQDISYAGLGAGLDGERSGLFFEAIRLVCELRPRIVVLENVAALLTRGLDRVLGTLAEIGFNAEWHCIPAAAVGAPHIRDRIFVIAYSKCNGWDEGGRIQWNKAATRERRSESSGGCQDMANATGSRSRTSRSLQSESQRASRSRGSCKRVGSGQWFTEPAVGRVANGVPNRVDRLRGLGNAVVPQVAEWIGRQIVKSVS